MLKLKLVCGPCFVEVLPRICAKSLTNIEKEAPHHNHWGFFRRPSEAEREKRRLSQQEKERADLDASKKYDHAQKSSQGAGVESQGGWQ